jgi:hypothetical protein
MMLSPQLPAVATPNLNINIVYNSHCKEISIYVFPEKELRGLSLNFHICVSVSDLYIPTIGLPIFLQQNMQTDPGNIKIGQRNLNLGIWTMVAQFLFWEYIIRISLV